MPAHFSFKILSPTLYRITEDDKFRENPFIYLVIGNNKLVLIDTGCGTGNLLEFVRSEIFTKAEIPENLKSKILVINTHNHFDHVAGNYLFSPNSVEKLDFCMDLCAGNRDRAYTEDPRNTIGALVGCVVKPYKVTRWLADMDQITLSDDGQNCFTVLHVPGHSPDSIALYYPKENRLFVGDFIYRWASILAVAVKSSLEDFQKSAEKLEKFVKNEEISRGKKLLLCCGHIDDSLESKYLTEFREMLTKVRRGEIQGVFGHLGMTYENEDGSLCFAHGSLPGLK